MFTVALFYHYWFFEATQKLILRRVLQIGTLLGWGKDWRRFFMCRWVCGMGEGKKLGGRFRRVVKEIKENNKIALEKRMMLITKLRIKWVHTIYNSPYVSIIFMWNFLFVSPTICSPLFWFQFSYFLIPFPTALSFYFMWNPILLPPHCSSLVGTYSGFPALISDHI